ncbi:YihY/virulence factor BrkB family protein [Thermoflavimicrobium daqui]|uniref:Ribonuclease n=1 Tax=Thermoflavimicrobium daqui TaxID=2137476 RepID=A0A364K9S7_9BACL|nr:YihY/virulence factor BrkB family protein [Thermoflavimicrobium daqui]RAL27057.1 ribonuclease [Thermoflavimicrobium daqui]
MITRFLREFIDRFIQDRVLDLAAQLAYYFLLSLFPFLFLVFNTMGYLPFSSEQILDLIHPYAPPSTYELIKSNLVQILDVKNGRALSLSVLASLYLASLAFQSIIRALNRAYRVKQTRSVWADIVLGLFLMFGLFVALIFSLLLPIIGQIIGEFSVYLFGLDPTYFIWNTIHWLISSLVIWLVFLCLYIFAPNTKVRFYQALPGAIFATLGWQISSFGFSYYVSINNYTLLYGNLGGIMILVGWFYVSAFVLIIGGQINAILCQLSKK